MKSLDKFFELIKISIGIINQFEELPTDQEWEELYYMAVKQSLGGVLFEGMNKVLSDNKTQKPSILYEWYALQLRTVNINSLQDSKSSQLYEFFANKGCKCCIIKGQGISRLYPYPEYRQCGDIDIWVGGSRKKIVGLMREQFLGVSLIDYVNCHVDFFTDTEVEVHFRPTYMYNPFRNRRLQRWIRWNQEEQMENYDSNLKFSYPTIQFNLVFSLIHIYRHIFSEGIGLRQLMDYYYILQHSTEGERETALRTIRSLGISTFAASVMYIMTNVFDLDSHLLLCQPDNEEGAFLLNEIIRGGNFGQYDDRKKRYRNNSSFSRGINSIRRNFLYLRHYPLEVMWMPIWKIWHWCWRKWKGYL